MMDIDLQDHRNDYCNHNRDHNNGCNSLPGPPEGGGLSFCNCDGSSGTTMSTTYN